MEECRAEDSRHRDITVPIITDTTAIIGSRVARIKIRKLPLEMGIKMIKGAAAVWLCEGEKMFDCWLAASEWRNCAAHCPPLSLVTLPIRAGYEPSRSLKFYNHRKGPYQGLLLIESAYLY